MSDILTNPCNISKNIVPMNGHYYTEVEFFHYVGNDVRKTPCGTKILIYDEEGNRKGKLPNRIATGWLRTEGEGNEVVYGNAMLVEPDHLR